MSNQQLKCSKLFFCPLPCLEQWQLIPASQHQDCHQHWNPRPVKEIHQSSQQEGRTQPHNLKHNTGNPNLKIIWCLLDVWHNILAFFRFWCLMKHAPKVLLLFLMLWQFELGQGCQLKQKRKTSPLCWTCSFTCLEEIWLKVPSSGWCWYQTELFVVTTALVA